MLAVVVAAVLVIVLVTLLVFLRPKEKYATKADEAGIMEALSDSKIKPPLNDDLKKVIMSRLLGQVDINDPLITTLSQRAQNDKILTNIVNNLYEKYNKAAPQAVPAAPQAVPAETSQIFKNPFITMSAGFTCMPIGGPPQAVPAAKQQTMLAMQAAQAAQAAQQTPLQF